MHSTDPRRFQRKSLERALIADGVAGDDAREIATEAIDDGARVRDARQRQADAYAHVRAAYPDLWVAVRDAFETRGVSARSRGERTALLTIEQSAAVYQERLLPAFLLDAGDTLLEPLGYLLTESIENALHADPTILGRRRVVADAVHASVRVLLEESRAYRGTRRPVVD